MKDLRVRLAKAAMKALSKAASELDMTPEQAFEYLVRNMLPIYPNLAEGGYCRYFHDGEYTANLWVKEHGMPFIEKLTSMLRSKELMGGIMSVALTANVGAKIEEEVGSLAKHFDMSIDDLYSGLVHVGSDLAVHLKTGTAYAYNKKDQNLGMIKFKP